MTSEENNPRASWIDCVKGIGILLVVYAHLLSSAYHAGLDIPERFFRLSDSIIYSFHMPLFFFVSGLFVEASYRKRGSRAYFLDRVRRLAYPYLVWSVLQVTVEILFSGQTQRGAGVPDLLAIPYRPWGQFWFLYALLLMHVLYILAQALGRFAKPALFAAALVLFFFTLPTGAFALFGFSGHLLFFITGVYLGDWLLRRDGLQVTPVVAVLLLLALVGAGYTVFTYLIEPVRLVGQPEKYIFLFLSILGILACIAIAQLLARRKILDIFAVLGKYSLPIFLAHMLVGVATRMALLALGVQNWMLHVVLGVAAALILPVLLQKLGVMTGFPYLFELPQAGNTGPRGMPLRANPRLDEQ
jgi:fucose 4-O-acetylase-like acetyltransferase